MFAPKVARPQTKAAAHSTNKLAPEGSVFTTRPFGGGAAEQALFLQRTIGNQAMLRDLANRLSNSTAKETEQHEPEARQATRETPRASWDFSTIPLYPPEKAGPPPSSSQFARASLSGAIQAKLVVGEVNDPLEHEADRVADQVMRMPDPAWFGARLEVKKSGEPQIRRVCAECEAEDESQKLQAKLAAGDTETIAGSGGAALVHEVLRSPGRPLDADARAFLEPRLQHDFSRVRVHTGSYAHVAAAALGARAFTVGPDIVFSAGEYAPHSAPGRHLLAHEVIHAVQQGASPRLRPGAYSVRVQSDSGEQVISAPPISTSGGLAGSAETSTPAVASDSGEEPLMSDVRPTAPEIQRLPEDTGLWLQRTASFVTPTPQPKDPLARLAQGLTPGLTTPMINANKVASSQDVLNAITPSQVMQTGSSGGQMTCGVTGFKIDTGAEQIVASAPGPGGWVGNAPPNMLGSPSACANVAQVPVKMTATPSNADFVKRVQGSEDEHVAELLALHNRHFVPYDKYVTGLSGTGVDLPTCGQNLLGKLNNRHQQATFGLVLGWAAANQKLDGPGGTHEDTATVTAAKDCSSTTITLGQSHPRIPGSAPGNVVSIPATVVNFDPTKLKVVGSALQDGATKVKSFSSTANAQAALAVIQHYGMTSRNTIGVMEFFLVGGTAPQSATLAGVSQFSIDPANTQVALGVPGLNASDWAITDIAGTAAGVNLNVIANFGAARDAAYSAWAVITSLGFTRRCWVGGTRQAPEMMYFTV